MLKDEGNDKFSEGEYQDALDEYEYALNLFDYEMANLLRDQVSVAPARQQQQHTTLTISPSHHSLPSLPPFLRAGGGRARRSQERPILR